MDKMTVIWKEPALLAFKEIYEWYYEQLSLSAALKFQHGVLSLIQLLPTNPYMGKVEPSLNMINGIEFRSFVEHKNHRIVYYIDNDVIYIADIWDCRMNR